MSSLIKVGLTDMAKNAVKYGGAALLGYEIGDILTNAESTAVKVIERPVKMNEDYQNNDANNILIGIAIAISILLFVGIVIYIAKWIKTDKKSNQNREDV